jgi:GGDEF domain-containing protein
MHDTTTLTIYLTGAFGGITVLVMLLSLLIGYAYSERMLWWHAATLASALSSQYWASDKPELSATLWLAQLALALQTLRVTAGWSGAMRRPAVALRALVLAFALLAALRPFGDQHICWLLLPWLAGTVWYLFRAFGQSRPWIYWLAFGQIALGLHGLLVRSAVVAPQQVNHQLSVMASLSVFAIATYLAMVWYSRLRTENSLRVEARERTDPLTGLATPRVFFDRVDGALIRSRNMGYASALLLIRVENLDAVVAEQNLENSEAAILAASRAIASTLRAQDSAARLANNRFAVMAEGIADGASSELATRILAHGLRANEWGLRGSELQFQISVVEIGSTDMEARAILYQLEEALKHMIDQRSRHHIRSLPRITRSAQELMGAS